MSAHKARKYVPTTTITRRDDGPAIWDLIFSGDPMTGTAGDDFMFGYAATSAVNNTMIGGSSDDFIIGDIGNFRTLASGANNGSLATAFDLDSAVSAWTTDENPLFGDDDDPHITVYVDATAGDDEWFVFTITGSANSRRVIIDVDYGVSAIGISTDTVIEVYFSNGSISTSNDFGFTVSADGLGSSSDLDPFIQAFYLPGTYYVRILESGASPAFEGGENFLLNISVENHATVADSPAGIDELRGGSGDDELFGGAGDDLLVGGSGNDLLHGGSGADAMDGGSDNDVFYVAFGDTVVEAPGGGDDRVVAAANITLYTLPAGAEVETLESLRFDDDVDLTGNEFGQVIRGNFYRNTLRGKDGNDTLYGFGGDDTLDGGLGADLLDGDIGTDTASYQSDSGAVFVNLRAGQGFGNSAQGDTYVGIENLIGSTGGDFLIGDDGVNRIDGSGGDDILLGGLGGDVLVGGSGSDTASYEDNWGPVFVNLRAGVGFGNAAQGDSYSGIENLTGGLFNDFFIGDDFVNRIDGGGGDDILLGGLGGDILIGGAGSNTASYEDNWGPVFVNLTTGVGFNNAAEGDSYTQIQNLTGGLFNDFFIGDANANRIAGGNGNDTLIGAGGADSFVFDTALGAGNVDTISDFVSGTDKIVLDDAIFTGLGLGALSPNAFFAGTAAHDADDRIIYNQATGALLFDADGNGAGAAVQFATLQGSPALNAGDFTVI